jgi:D-amino-acid oxidase
MPSNAEAIVVGCGVSGLSSAVALAEAGRAVTIWTRDLPPRTTSSVAGAIWYPYKVAPLARVAEWARRTYGELVELAREPGSGVTLAKGVELLPFGAHDEGDEFRSAAPDLRELSPSELPRGFERGFELSVPVCEMPLYLEYLLRRFESAGGVVELRRLASLDEALAKASLVVNCVGLAARELVGDPHMRPIRGQVLRVEKLGVERFVLDDYDPRGVTYVIPRSHDCVIGGTTDEGVEELTPDEAATHAILERCAELEPRLAQARILSVAVGLRPGRTEVRLERERRGAGALIHNYGHGGAGVTLSWGCAFEVLELSGRPLRPASSS